MNLSGFILEDGVYCQEGFSGADFEREYFSIRQKEERILDDETVRKLPFLDHREWKIRAKSAKKLVEQLKKENCRSIIELGCGNGWLTNYIQGELSIPATGIDVVKYELKQAARISDGRTTFIYGNIFSMDEIKADAIILAACVQYFPDLKKLFNKLDGTIHIIDSPFYDIGGVTDAHERSRKYFRSKHAEGMSAYYFHHEKLGDAEVLYQPNRLKVFFGDSPFPWLRIRKGS